MSLVFLKAEIIMRSEFVTPHENVLLTTQSNLNDQMNNHKVFKIRF